MRGLTIARTEMFIKTNTIEEHGPQTAAVGLGRGGNWKGTHKETRQSQIYGQKPNTFNKSSN